MPTFPKRPCLVVKNEQIDRSDTDCDTKSPANDQKWVAFYSVINSLSVENKNPQMNEKICKMSTKKKLLKNPNIDFYL